MEENIIVIQQEDYEKSKENENITKVHYLLILGILCITETK